MQVRRHMTKTRRGHWILTLVNTTLQHRAASAKHSTRHAALAEEDKLMAALVALAQAQTDFAAGRPVQFV